ncbi:MAG TPA: sugar ABC transporter permease [Clostridiaceae bacterium]|nr:sugar ABC transporter permease [Clostridiaceae bacterium]
MVSFNTVKKGTNIKYKNVNSIEIKNELYYFLFTVPALVILFIFLIIPLTMGFFMSFTDWDGISTTVNFVGLKNYSSVLTTNRFRTVLKNTFYLMILFIPIMNALAVIMAVLVSTLKAKLANFFKSAIFYPNLLCLIVVGFVWRLIYDYNNGLINSTLRSIGLNSLVKDWIGDPNMVMNSIAVVFIWSCVGYYLLIYAAGIMAIPNDLYEAAEIEGCGEIKKFRFITLPMLAPSITRSIVLSTTLVFSSFGLILALSDGGPGYASQTLPLEVYHYAFIRFRTTQGLAAGMILGLLVSILIIIELNFLLKREEIY